MQDYIFPLLISASNLFTCLQLMPFEIYSPVRTGRRNAIAPGGRQSKRVRSIPGMIEISSFYARNSLYSVKLLTLQMEKREPARRSVASSVT
jgi:hypothetical protein